MKIVNTERSEYCGNDGIMVAVTVLNEDGKQVTFHIQTFDGRYNKAIGYPIYGTGYTEINEEDYGDVLKEVIKEAERYARSTYKVEALQTHFNYVFKISDDGVTFSVRNPRFIDPDKTPSQIEYIDIKSFKTLEKAKAFIVDRLEYD